MVCFIRFTVSFYLQIVDVLNEIPILLIKLCQPFQIQLLSCESQRYEPNFDLVFDDFTDVVSLTIQNSPGFLLVLVESYKAEVVVKLLAVDAPLNVKRYLSALFAKLLSATVGFERFAVIFFA